jgi:hypothetical protein
MGRPTTSNGDFRERVEVPVARRLTALMKDVPLDCECRSRFEAALTRFSALEFRRSAREQLDKARRWRERIEAILYFLKDLNELSETEPDRSVYAEMAFLFDDVAEIAKEGADALRLIR